MQRTLEEHKAIIDNAIGVLDGQIAHIRMLRAINAELLAALKDMYGGWRYIRQSHGDLYGVGWDRAGWEHYCSPECSHEPAAGIAATERHLVRG